MRGYEIHGKFDSVGEIILAKFYPETAYIPSSS